MQESKPRASAPGVLEGIAEGPREKRDHEIDWHEWSEQLFEKAKEEEKLILLDISAQWCHWCHVMDETSYSDPANIELINENFLPVRVDGDERPDVQDRYLHSGWPTTAVLLPSGEVIAAESYVPPQQLNAWLNSINNYYRNNREEIIREVREARERELEAAEQAPDETPGLEINWDAYIDIHNAARDEVDRQYGGLGTSPKFPVVGAYELLLNEAWEQDDEELLEEAQLALDGLAKLEDEVWGGFYRYATDRQWEKPHYEKLLADQAELLRLFTRAHRLLDADYSGLIERTVAYCDEHLACDGWGFCCSQDADVGSHDGDSEFIPGEEYFELGDEARREAGIPHVDESRYAFENGLFAGALAEAGFALDRPEWVDRAGELADNLYREHFDGSTLVRTTESDDPATDLLKDYIGMLHAGLALVQAEGSDESVERVAELAGAMEEKLWDDSENLFTLGGLPELDADDPLVPRPTPLPINSQAARILTRIGRGLHQRRLHSLAEKIVTGLSQDASQYGMQAGTLALAMREVSRYPRTVHLVTAEGSDADLSGLLRAAADNAEPCQLMFRHTASTEVENDDESLAYGAEFGRLTFKTGDEPTAYVCEEGQCSSPVNSPDELADALSHLNDKLRRESGEIAEEASG